MQRESVQLEFCEGPEAFGGPGAEPRWAPGCKQAVGTAAGSASNVWFTVAEGVLTEVYYPRVDTANTRDLQFLVADGHGGVWDERRGTRTEVGLIDPRALAWRVVTEEDGGRFRIEKRILTDPERPSVVVRARWRSAPGDRLFVLFAPHVRDRGGGNSARLARVGGRTLLLAWRHDVWVAVGASCPVPRASCGFVGASDGWTDLRAHGDLTWAFASAQAGNVALAAQLDPGADPFTLAMGFGRTAEEACANALATVDQPYASLEGAYVAGWNAYCAALDDLSAESGDGGRGYYLGAMVLKAHEGKESPGAHIASLAVPWGEASGDSNAGGYHLVWPRDLYHAATARLAAGDAPGALAALRYLERTQRGDGTWPQNFWTYGEPYWRGLQLDEQAFPILLAWQLKRAGALDHNPYPGLIRDAAYAIARLGPVTQQERWEENSGYSPSTLASCIAALCCAAEFACEDRDPAAERYFLDVADYWAAKIEDWTCDAADGHYERIVPELPPDAAGTAGRAQLRVANLPPGVGRVDVASVLDGGFLELVRYGVRPPDDARVRRTLAAYDAACRVQTPRGPCWRRYTYDGYGQKDDGSPYDGTGRGRAWPLLTGERAHYELALLAWERARPPARPAPGSPPSLEAGAAPGLGSPHAPPAPEDGAAADAPAPGGGPPDGAAPDGGPPRGAPEDGAPAPEDGAPAPEDAPAARPPDDGGPVPLARALERFANEGGMIPEQVWDAPPIPEKGLYPGGPTGSAAPLVWAHAEYVKLLRSLRDGAPFDRPDPAYRRYVLRRTASDLVVWKFNHKIRSAPASARLRLEVYAPAALHWTWDGWRHVRHDPFDPRGHGVWTFDLPREALAPGRAVEFTFYWHESGTWEGKDFRIELA